MDGERELVAGLLSKDANFRVIVSGTVGVKEIERLISKLELDKEILAEADGDADATVEQSAITLIQGIATQLAALIANGATLVAASDVEAVVSQLNTNAAALAAAVTANTPAPTPAPTPSPTP